uniref:BZIP domain-containing protein n=1 Tax=Haemonchus placei TaxID=6290 RepID=A0A0N4X0M4_HAEPC
LQSKRSKKGGDPLHRVESICFSQSTRQFDQNQQQRKEKLKKKRKHQRKRALLRRGPSNYNRYGFVCRT